MKAIHMRSHAAPGRTRQILYGLVLLLLALALASVLVPLQSSIDMQDAAQYRLNLETGLYETTYDSGKSAFFAVIVRFLLQQGAVSDPFATISVLICAAYLIRMFQMRLGWRSLAISAFMLAMAPIFLNYTQLLRQGVASALAIYGLTAAALPAAIGLMVLAAAMHQTFLLFTSIALARRLVASAVVGTLNTWRDDRLLLWFDRIILLLIPLGLSLFLVFGDSILTTERAQIYLNFDSVGVQRIAVSLLQLCAAWTLFTTRRSHLAALAINLLTFTALSLPFVYDFLRLQTLVMPFLFFAALELRGSTRGRLAMGIAMSLAFLVSASTGQLPLL